MAFWGSGMRWTCLAFQGILGSITVIHCLSIIAGIRGESLGCLSANVTRLSFSTNEWVVRYYSPVWHDSRNNDDALLAPQSPTADVPSALTFRINVCALTCLSNL